LVEAVNAVASGRRYLDPELAQKLALSEFDGASKSPVERLSEREFEVFMRLAGGASVARIAHRRWAHIFTTSSRSWGWEISPNSP
jgi:two-component system, NarL family, invasion response regulator UvrY